MKKIIVTATATTALVATLGARALMAPIHLLTGDDVRTQDASFAISNIHRLKLKLAFSQVHVISDSSSKIELHVKRWAKRPTSAGVRKWLDSGDLVVITGSDQISFQDSPLRTNTESQISKGENEEAREEVTLHIPQGLDLEIKLGAGTIDTKGNFRSVASNLGVGEVSAHLDTCPTEDSSIHVGAGNARIALPSGTNATVSASVGVGHISGLPADDQDKSKVGDRRTGVVGSGTTNLEVHVGAGDVWLTTPQTVRALLRNSEQTGMAAQKFDTRSDQDQDSDQASSPDSADLDKIGQDVDRALEQAQPQIDRSMEEARPEMDKAFAEIGPAIRRAMKEVGPQIKRALREAKPEIERARREHPEQFEREMLRVKPEIKRAIAEAMEAMNKAEAEMDRKEMHDLDDHGHLKELVKQSLRAARAAMEEAFGETEKSLHDSKD